MDKSTRIALARVVIMSNLKTVDHLPKTYLGDGPVMLRANERVYWFDRGKWVCDKTVDELAVEIVERSEAEEPSPPLPLESDLGDAFAWGMP